MRHIAILASMLLGSMVTAQTVHPEEYKLKPQIDTAIANGVEFLIDSQLRDGSWGVASNHVGGQSGLCLYALQKCGLGRDHPAMRRGFGYLDSITPTNTYAIGCMMLAYGVSGTKEHLRRMRELLIIMLRCQSKQGTWAYPHGDTDLSNTQYAALGLWSAVKVGLKVPPEAWNRLIAGTLEHQEMRHLVDVEVTGNTGTGKREVAGFEYRPREADGPNNATGTMTTAGISVLKICEIGLGKKLRKKPRRELTAAMDAGMRWLDVYFSVTSDQKPNARGGKWLLYYLYGMERVGGLLRKEKFGDHWWYVDGAKVILKRQKKNNGGWGNAVHDTCFALLFLRRATISGPSTGTGSGSGKTRHLFSAGREGDDVLFHGAGQDPLMLYITGFGELLLEDHARHGLRILRVEYLEGTRKLGHLAGDPMRVWTPTETFMHRCPPLSHGAHTIKAHIIAIDPKLPLGDASKTVTIKSLPMQVKIRDVVDPWMDSFAGIQANNLLKSKLLKGKKPQIETSSNSKQKDLVADGMIHTHWLCEKEDANPTVTIKLPVSLKVRRLILVQPMQKQEDLERIAPIMMVEVSWNKGKKTSLVAMNRNPLAPTVFELPKPVKMSKLIIRVKSRGGRAGLPVGFSEVLLEGTRKRK